MIKIPAKIQYVLENIRENGFEAYIVGGCVRDMLRGETPTDFDVTTSATPETIMEIFKKTVPTGIKHGTVTVLVEKEAVEVTTYRTEGGYKDSRHPENVQFVSSLKEDLARRDFTVNALAFDGQTGIVDYFGGLCDLENKLLRAVGEPKLRFSEDALRILRLFRFASVLCFAIDPATENAALNLSGNLQNISRERIAVELKKAVSGKNFKSFAPLINSGALNFLGISACPDFMIVEKCFQNENLAFFAFLETADCDAGEISHELKLSNSLRRYIANLQLLNKNIVPTNKVDLKNQLKSALDIPTYRDFLFYKSACGCDTAAALKMLEEILQNNEPYLIPHLAISGSHLNELGIKGETVGIMLQKLLKIVIESPQENTVENLKNILKNL